MNKQLYYIGLDRVKPKGKRYESYISRGITNQNIDLKKKRRKKRAEVRYKYLEGTEREYKAVK